MPAASRPLSVPTCFFYLKLTGLYEKAEYQTKKKIEERKKELRLLKRSAGGLIYFARTLGMA
jgi:hypothetical protein